ncbi:tyrosine-type recombinase/integrase [Pseudalkalibacillus sp. JSM 102089]|uniref:tyrosine-type recombinase/integrase n=1 Tax=Pseudalkalibacillus sp. JSM 102089 TaxID=3229856 RepID=UPI00352513B4
MEIEDVLEEYIYHCQARAFTPKTLINKQQEYKQLKKFLKERRGITELESITVFDLRAYVRGKQQSGLKPQSIVCMCKNISAFFNWCVGEEYLKENIMKKVELPKVPKVIHKGFTGEEVQAMIDAFTYENYISARNKAIIAMLSDIGLRSIELRTLTVENVKGNTILVNGKGNKERMLSISPVLKKILIKYERLRKQYFSDKIIRADRYFLSYTGDELSHVGLYNIIKLAGKRAGIEGKRVSPHSFRHFYSVQCLNNGNLDLHSLSLLLGHSEVTTTQRYLSSMSNQQLLNKAVASSPLMNLNRKSIR